MARYGQAFKDRVVVRLMAPESARVEVVAREEADLLRCKLNRFVYIVTGVGGHFLNGNRRKGYAYFFALATWPLLFFFLQVTLLLIGFWQAANPTGQALFFLSGLAAIWTVSVRQALQDGKSKGQAERGPVTSILGTFEIAVLSLLIYAAAVYGIFGFAAKRHLRVDEEVPLLEGSSEAETTASPKVLPLGNGNLVLVGELRESDGKLLSNARLQLRFQDRYQTPEILTNSQGRFEYRMPPGEWHLAAPVIVSNEERSFNVVFTPYMRKPWFLVGSGPVTSKIFVRMTRKLPRQVDRLLLESAALVSLGRNRRGGSPPRAS